MEESNAELILSRESKVYKPEELIPNNKSIYRNGVIPHHADKDEWTKIIEKLREQYVGRDFLRTQRTDYGGKSLEFLYLPKGMSDYGTHWRKLSTLSEDHYWFMGYYYMKLGEIRKERVIYVEHEQTTDVALAKENTSSMVNIIDTVTTENNPFVEVYVPELVVLAERVY